MWYDFLAKIDVVSKMLQGQNINMNECVKPLQKLLASLNSLQYEYELM